MIKIDRKCVNTNKILQECLLKKDNKNVCMVWKQILDKCNNRKELIYNSGV